MLPTFCFLECPVDLGRTATQYSLTTPPPLPLYRGVERWVRQCRTDRRACRGWHVVMLSMLCVCPVRGPGHCSPNTRARRRGNRRLTRHESRYHSGRWSAAWYPYPTLLTGFRFYLITIASIVVELRYCTVAEFNY